MAKYTKKDYQKEACLIANYRWEFLRRNKKYRKDCANRSKFSAGHWQKKYGISFPYNPQDNFSKLPKKSASRFLFERAISPAPAVILNDIRDEPICDKDIDRQDVVEDILFKEADSLNSISVVNLLVDVTRRKEIILAELDKIISYWKKVRANKTRVIFKKYDIYLMIYDWKENGCSWREIARKLQKRNLEPGWNKADTENLRRHALRAYNQCKKLIDGGYRQIR